MTVSAWWEVHTSLSDVFHLETAWSLTCRWNLLSPKSSFHSIKSPTPTPPHTHPYPSTHIPCGHSLNSGRKTVAFQVFYKGTVLSLLMSSCFFYFQVVSINVELTARPPPLSSGLSRVLLGHASSQSTPGSPGRARQTGSSLHLALT